MTRIFIAPDDGREYKLVPKVATNAMRAAMGADWAVAVYETAIAAAPQCKVVELPKPPSLRYSDEYRRGFAACLGAIIGAKS